MPLDCLVLHSSMLNNVKVMPDASEYFIRATKCTMVNAQFHYFTAKDMLAELCQVWMKLAAEFHHPFLKSVAMKLPDMANPFLTINQFYIKSMQMFNYDPKGKIGPQGKLQWSVRSYFPLECEIRSMLRLLLPRQAALLGADAPKKDLAEWLPEHRWKGGVSPKIFALSSRPKSCHRRQNHWNCRRKEGKGGTVHEYSTKKRYKKNRK